MPMDQITRLEDVSPIKNGDFPASHLRFRGLVPIRFMTPAQLMNATSAEALETIAPLENDVFWEGCFPHIIHAWHI